MTLRPGSNARGHHSHAIRRARTPLPLVTEEPIKHAGITRQPDRQRTAQDLPLSERHEQVLALVGNLPRGPKVIGDQLGISRSSANASLYALQDRGLVTRIQGKGWVLAGPQAAA